MCIKEYDGLDEMCVQKAPATYEQLADSPCPRL